MLTAAIRLGEGYWLWLGPAIVAVALVVFVALTVHASRKRKFAPRDEHVFPDRGTPVHGGIIEGDPGQRNRRD